MLTNSLKILDTTENQSCKHKFLQKDQKIWQNYCRADVSSVSEHATCWLSISVQTRGFLGISVTTPFAVYNFGRKPAMRLIFSFKNFKIWCRFEKFRKKLKKYFGLGDNCIWIGWFKHSLLLKENTCYSELIC